MGCPSNTPGPGEAHPLLAALAHLEAATHAPVDGEQLAALLHLRATWGSRWRKRLGLLLCRYERAGRVRRVAARRADGRGRKQKRQAGWSVVAVACELPVIKREGPK
jgi:hypothetical protein